ncbi:HlyC/CorC family transporter [Acetobacteraceae bacterium]|nr:HlyC/CorC family transporter [Acetobacteraceae bacterium]
MIALAIVSLLIVLNGIFAMGEMALISVKKPRLEMLARNGVRGAGRALTLSENPQEFLPTVQVGLTLVSIIEGAFGGNKLEGAFTELLLEFQFSKTVAEHISVAVVVAGIATAMLVFGELVPKRLGLQFPDKISIWLSGFFLMVSQMMRPVIWFLNFATSLTLKIFRVPALSPAVITEEELRGMLAEGARAGILEGQERQMIERLMRIADRPVRALMTPRNDLVWIDLHITSNDLVKRLRRVPAHTRFVVCDGSVDNPIGVILAKDIMERLLQGQKLSIQDLIRTPPIVPDIMTGQAIIDRLRNVPIGIVFVMDEYGSFEGIVTPTDIFDAIIGEDSVTAPLLEKQKGIVAIEDDNLVLDGDIPKEDAAFRLGIHEFPVNARFHTLAGVLLALLKKVPAIGDCVEYEGWSFQVVGMERRRITRIHVKRLPII